MKRRSNDGTGPDRMVTKQLVGRDGTIIDSYDVPESVATRTASKCAEYKRLEALLTKT